MPATAEEVVTDIANGALLLVRRPPLASYADDSHPDAAAVRLAWPSVRDDLLRRQDWNFALAKTRPAASTTADIGPLAIRYPLPGDCLKVRLVEGLADDEWELVEAGADGGQSAVLVCNAIAPIVHYTRRITDGRLWDASFVHAFKAALAAEIAPMVAGSMSIAAALDGQADKRVMRAARADAREKAPSQVSRDTSWLRARW